MFSCNFCGFFPLVSLVDSDSSSFARHLALFSASRIFLLFSAARNFFRIFPPVSWQICTVPVSLGVLAFFRHPACFFYFRQPVIFSVPPPPCFLADSNNSAFVRRLSLFLAVFCCFVPPVSWQILPVPISSSVLHSFGHPAIFVLFSVACNFLWIISSRSLADSDQFQNCQVSWKSSFRECIADTECGL